MRSRSCFELHSQFTISCARLKTIVRQVHSRSNIASKEQVLVWSKANVIFSVELSLETVRRNCCYIRCSYCAQLVIVWMVSHVKMYSVFGLSLKCSYDTFYSVVIANYYETKVVNINPSIVWSACKKCISMIFTKFKVIFYC